MIIPYSESDLSLSILVLGSELLSEYDKTILINDALIKFIEKDKRRTPELFIDTLTFLYTVGVVEIKGYKLNFVKNDSTQTALF
jgi:hypothetical protein